MPFVRVMEELHLLEFVVPGLGIGERLAEFVLELLLVVGVLEQILAQLVHEDVAVGDDAVGLAVVGRQLAVIADRVHLVVGFFMYSSSGSR